MNLSVITVTWNSAAHIAEQIRSVSAGAIGLSFEQIVVDNGSKDKTVEIVKEFGEVILIENGANLGFAAANNEGAKRATGEFLLFLNPDMRVLPGTLIKAVGWMKEHTEAGIASVKLTDEAGVFNPHASPRRLPRLFDQLALIFKISHVFPAILSHYTMKDFDAEKTEEVESVRGSFLLIRREIVERLGWAFDPRYFIWFEDVDLCREVRGMGYKIFYIADIACVDYVGQGFAKQGTYEKQKRFTKSMLIYFQKWEAWYVWVWIALARPVGMGLAFIKSRISG